MNAEPRSARVSPRGEASWQRPTIAMAKMRQKRRSKPQNQMIYRSLLVQAI